MTDIPEIMMTTGCHDVVVLENMGEWHVLIVENGVERSQSFVQENWAINYARGQRVRLGLPKDIATAAQAEMQTAYPL